MARARELTALLETARALLESAPPPSTSVGVADSRAWFAQRDDWLAELVPLPAPHADYIEAATGGLSKAGAALPAEHAPPDPILEKLMLLLGDTWSSGPGDVAMKGSNYSDIIRLVDELRKANGRP